MVCGRGGSRVSATLVEPASTMGLQEIGSFVTKMWLKLNCLGIVVLPPRRGDIISGCA
jgi:hypothetical protein